MLVGRTLTVGDMTTMIGVPVGILAAGGSVEIKDGVDTILCAQRDHPVKVFETVLFEHAGVKIV